MTFGPHPSDIYWIYMKLGQPIMYCKRIIFNILIFLFLLFFTTPSAVIHTLGFDELINKEISSLDYIGA